MKKVKSAPHKLPPVKTGRSTFVHNESTTPVTKKRVASPVDMLSQRGQCELLPGLIGFEEPSGKSNINACQLSNVAIYICILWICSTLDIINNHLATCHPGLCAYLIIGCNPFLRCS